MKQTVTVSGFGVASAPADSMLVRLTVRGEGADVATALDAASTALPRVTAALRAGGVGDRDLATTSISVGEHYDHRKDEQTGYVCRNHLRVLLRDVAGSGRLLRDVATAAGDALRIDDVSLQIVDISDLAVRARQAAFEHARLQADQYAKLAGTRLGEVVSVRDGGGSRGNDHIVNLADGAASARGGMEGAAALPVEAGELNEQTMVIVCWQLLR